jgi:hypothetical protein
MKLQLTKTETRKIAEAIGSAPTLWEAVTKTLAQFREIDHTPFTRKDVNAVMMALGWPNSIGKSTENPNVGIFDQAFYPQVEHLPRPKRGYYALTDASATPMAPTPQKSRKPKAPEINIESGEAVVWVPETPTPTNAGYYADDVGLRRIAVAESKCYGHYDAGASPCVKCPLAGFCASASVGSMADIAAKLDAATEKHLADVAEAARVAALPAATPAPATPASAPAPSAPAPTANVYPDNASELEVPFEGICTKCGDTIAEGSLGVHVPGEGMLHPACARTN